MSRVSKILMVSGGVLFVLACNFVTQPVKDVQNLAGTAQSIASAIPIETLQALPSAIASVIPAETLEALPSSAPTIEALATQFGNALKSARGSSSGMERYSYYVSGNCRAGVH